MELDENIIRKNKIPVLIKDKTWKRLFEADMTKSMKKSVKELEKLLVIEKKTKSQFRAYQKVKKKLMEDILHLSDEVNNNHNESALEELEKTKEEILKINDKIDELQFRLETLPGEIEKYNLELLKETIDISYSNIRKENERAIYFTEKIASLRQELSDAWEEKLNAEQKVEDLYSYLHNTMGYEETNKLDKQFL